MKKLLSLALALTMCTALFAGCSSSETSTSSSSTTTSSSSSSSSTTTESASEEKPTTDFPKKSLELVVTSAAGGSSDILARALIDNASDYLGQSIAVSNISDAGGVIAATQVHNDTSGGYSLLFAPSGVFDTIPNFQDVGYSLDGFTILGGVCVREIFVYVSADSPYDTFEEFVEAKQAAGESIKYGSSGTNNTIHVAQAALYANAGVAAENVPLGGEAEVFTNVIGGHIDAGYCHEGLAKQYMDEGLIKPLAILCQSSSGVESLSGVPTCADLGYDNMNFYITTSIAVSSNAPADAIEVLKEAFAEMLDTDEFKNFVTDNSMGVLMPGVTAEEVEATLNANSLVIQEVANNMGM